MRGLGSIVPAGTMLVAIAVASASAVWSPQSVGSRALLQARFEQEATADLRWDFTESVTPVRGRGELLHCTWEPQAGGARVPEHEGVAVYRARAEVDFADGEFRARLRSAEQSGLAREFLLTIESTVSFDHAGGPELVVGAPGRADAPGTGQVYFTQPGEPVASAPTATFESLTPRGMASGDIDGDGQLDLVVSMNHGDEVHVFRGPPVAGELWQPVQRLPVPQPQGVALADVDHDGDLDLIVASFVESLPPLVGFANEGGKFELMDWRLGHGPGEAIAVGDVDRDGVLDVLQCSFHVAISSKIWFGSFDDDGHYQLGHREYVALPHGVLGGALADLDRDGWLDVVLARTYGDFQDRTSTGEIMVFRGLGEGRFGGQPDWHWKTLWPFTVCADRDVNHDGWLDVVVANWGRKPTFSKASHAFLGPNFERSLEYPVDSAVSMTLVDLDGDQIDDVMWRTSRADRSPVHYLNVDGTVRASEMLPTQPSTLGMGVLGVSGGSAPYGALCPPVAAIELFAEGRELCLSVAPTTGAVRSVRAALPRGKWIDVVARWSSSSGRLELRIEAEGQTAAVAEEQGEPFSLAPLSRRVHLGTDHRRQRVSREWRWQAAQLTSGEPE